MQVSPEVATVTEKALGLVDLQYGIGPETTQTRLSYHNGLHTRYVMQDTVVLSEMIGLEADEVAAGLCAAAAHDLVQGFGRKEDELRSADWLAFQMEQQPHMAAVQVEMARLAIIGTEPIFENGAMQSQMVEQLDFPSMRHERVAKLVASADLGRLFSREGPYLAHLLLKELSGGKVPETVDALISFQHGQLPFLESYRYPLSEANRLLASQKSEVLAHHERLIEGLDSGRITSWQELIARDLAFMRGISTN